MNSQLLESSAKCGDEWGEGLTRIMLGLLHET